MNNLEKAPSWFLSCLGVVLIGAAILVVPANAFANAGSYCIGLNNCTGMSGSGAPLGYCVGPCCATYGDPNCCSEACGSDSACLAACISLQPCDIGCDTGGCDSYTPPNCPAQSTGCNQDAKNTCAGCLCTARKGSDCGCGGSD